MAITGQALIVLVASQDLTTISQALCSPIEQAYPDAVVKVCASVCDQTPSENVLIQFMHVLSKNYKRPELRLPYYDY